MILFYSDSCPHSKMLIETIKRYNATDYIKFVSIDVLRALGKNLPQIHSVPALMIVPENQLLFGKDVFDYLLLPRTGKLLNIQELKSNKSSSPNQGLHNQGQGQGQNQQQPQKNIAPSQQTPAEPAAFTLSGGTSGFSDNFSMIENDDSVTNFGIDDRTYSWASLDPTDMDKLKSEDANSFSVDTRPKKTEFNLDEYRAKRALDLEQNHLNTSQLLPPNTTR